MGSGQQKKVPVIFHSIRDHLPSGWGRDFLLATSAMEKGVKKQNQRRSLIPRGFLCLPRLDGWSDPGGGLLPAQMVLGGRAACPTLLSPWLQIALSPAGHEIGATWLHFNLHAEDMMFFSRLGGKHKAGSDNQSPGVSEEASHRSWLTLSLHFSRMCADVAMFPLSIFSMSQSSGFALSHRFSTLHLAKRNPEKSPR